MHVSVVMYVFLSKCACVCICVAVPAYLFCHSRANHHLIMEKTFL